MIKLSIIIVSYNTVKLTTDCIKSIYNSKLNFNFEIIVIDNASKDNSVEVIRNNWPEIILINNSENRLFAQANNQGARLAKGKYLLLLNSDTIVLKNEIEKLIDFMEHFQNNIACVGPTVLNEDGTIQSQGFALASIFERVTMVFKLNKIIPTRVARYVLPTGIPGLINSNHEVGWVAGCCMLIRKEIYISLGGLNENLQFYGEEPEFGFRLKQHGYKSWLISEAKIIHLGGKSSDLPEASFLKDLDGKLFRYGQLQKFTVGYSKAIIMSQVVIFSAWLKLIVTSSKAKKEYFSKAIEYELKVADYLKKMKNSENKNNI